MCYNVQLKVLLNTFNSITVIVMYEVDSVYLVPTATVLDLVRPRKIIFYLGSNSNRYTVVKYPTTCLAMYLAL